MPLRILRSDIDGQTAHVSVQFRVVDVHPVTGAITEGQPETVGIDHITLMRSFHGPAAPSAISIRAAILQWLRTHHDGAMARKRAIESVAHEIGSLRDQVIFGEHDQ